MTVLSLAGGVQGEAFELPEATKTLSIWVEALQTNTYYRAGRRPEIPDVWSFKWHETNLISIAGYEKEFKQNPGIYMFLKDEGTPDPYEPIYIGMAGGKPGSSTTQSISERMYQRYIPKNQDNWYRPPKQLQILELHGNKIRRNDPAWPSHRRQLEALGMSKVRLDHAEHFSELTVVGPYLTFHPIPKRRQEEIALHKRRILKVERVLISAGRALGFDLCNQ